MLLRSSDLKDNFEILEDGLYKVREIDIKYLTIYKQIKDNPHPNLKNIKKIINQANGVIVLEKYYFGETLEELLNNKFSKQQLEQLIIELLSAIKYFHKVNIIHHDIKPNNIIFSEGKFILIDYNISRISNSTEKNTRYFVSDGFSPPEQYGFGATSYASDIFSFGKTIEYVMKKAQIRSQYYETFIKKATQLDPKLRYTNIFEVEKYLEELAHEEHLKESENTSYLDFFLSTWGLKKDEKYKTYTLMITIILIEKLILIYNQSFAPEYIMRLILFYLIGYLIYAKTKNFGYYFIYINMLIAVILSG